MYQHRCSGPLCKAVQFVHCKRYLAEVGAEIQPVLALSNLKHGGRDAFFFLYRCYLLIELYSHGVSVCSQVMPFSNSFTQHAIPLPKLHKHISSYRSEAACKSSTIWEFYTTGSDWFHHIKEISKIQRCRKRLRNQILFKWTILKMDHKHTQ